MDVKELIIKLQEYPDYAPVSIWLYHPADFEVAAEDDDFSGYTKVREIQYCNPSGKGAEVVIVPEGMLVDPY